MTDLDSLLGALRDEYEPDAGARHRVRRAVATTLAAGVVAGAGTAATASAATAGAANGAGFTAGAGGASAGAVASGGVPVGVGAAGSAGAGVKLSAGAAGAAASGALRVGVLTGGWFKAVVGVGAVSAISALALMSTPSTAPQGGVTEAPPAATEASPTKQTSLPPSNEEPQIAAVQDEPALDDRAQALSEGAPDEVANTEPAVSKPVTRKRTKARPEPAQRNAPSSMMEELRLIRAASQALRAGDGAQARGLLSEHRRRFPLGTLTQERRGLELLLQCDGGGASARAQAEKFLAASPQSPLAESIRKRCLK